MRFDTSASKPRRDASMICRATLSSASYFCRSTPPSIAVRLPLGGLTHLHTDHAGGVHHFPDNEILVSRAELDYAAGLRGRFRGYPNKRWPAWFRPTLVDLPAVPFGPFPASMTLTEAGDVTLVPVPGHSPGQLAVVVEDVDQAVLLAGDSSYSQDALLRWSSTASAPTRPPRLTHQRIRAYTAQTPTVYLPAPDPETAARLVERRTIEAAREMAIA